MTLNIAHRGASGYVLENTMEAFEKAIALGCDGIETDVQISKDGKLVLIHDERVDRTTTGTGYVKDHDFEELKALGVPLLEDLLVLAKKHGILLNLELKNTLVQYPGLEEKVIRMIMDYGMETQVIISSFNHYSMVKCKRLAPQIQTGLLYIEPLYEPEKYCLNAWADAIHPDYRTLNKEVVAAAHDKGVKVHPYTINEESDIDYMIEIGVDMIISNYPDRVKKQLENKLLIVKRDR